MVESLAGLATDFDEDGIPTPLSVCHKIPPHCLIHCRLSNDGSLNH